MASSYKLNQVQAKITIGFFNILQRLIWLSFLTLMLDLRSGWVYADNNSTDVLIVGAGLSGLSSAYYLDKAGKVVNFGHIISRIHDIIKISNALITYYC